MSCQWLIDKNHSVNCAWATNAQKLCAFAPSLVQMCGANCHYHICCRPRPNISQFPFELPTALTLFEFRKFFNLRNFCVRKENKTHIEPNQTKPVDGLLQCTCKPWFVDSCFFIFVNLHQKWNSNYSNIAWTKWIGFSRLPSPQPLPLPLDGSMIDM